MICQVCHQNPATVHITEILEKAPGPESQPQAEVTQQHVCQKCAKQVHLPELPTSAKKSVNEIWKLLQETAAQKQRVPRLACPHCGTTLEDFRTKGRLGCAHDYEVFAEHLGPLLKRMHNAAEHKGRVPGLDEGQLERQRQILELREALDRAVREERYESAAQLRDELNKFGS